MRPYTRITGILAILVLMVAGAWANAQSANKKAGDSPATSNAGTSASSKNKVKTNGSLQSVQSNPLYKDNREGTNPLYERDSAAKTKAPSSGATMSHEVVEYKDNDDRTTRYRPGNNKTAKVTPTGNTAGAAVVEYKDGEDGTMHTRPSNPK